jgi:hypothetical protein
MRGMSSRLSGHSSETIQRFVFRECQEGKHELCRVWDAGMVDGQLRSAGIQCSCECHDLSKKDKILVVDLTLGEEVA